MLTSLSDPNDILKGLEFGTDSFITKPYTEEFLLSKIHYLLSNFTYRQKHPDEKEVEIIFRGQKHLITSNRLQILDLLFSTYENTLLQNEELNKTNKELGKVQFELKKTNHNLEQIVEERTRELIKNQHLLVTVTSEVPIVMFSINKDGIFTLSNGKGLKKLGLNPGQVVGLSIFDVYREYPNILAAISQALEGEEIRLIEVVNGVYFDTLYQPVKDEAGDVVSVVGVAIDVTQQKLYEEKLQESEEKFRTVFKNSMLGKSITGIDGSLKVNSSFCKMLGYTEKEIQEKHWKEITHPEDIKNSSAVVQELLEGKTNNAHFEKRYIHKNGQVIFSDVQTTLYRNEHGEPQFFITAVNDITARKKAEEKLNSKTLQLEKSNKEKEELIATKDKLMSIISHDLLGNFNSLLGFTDILAHDAGNFSKEDISKMGTTLNDSFYKQYQLLNNLLEWGRIQQGIIQINPVKVNLGSCIRETSELLKQNLANKNIVIESEVGTDLEIYADKHMLEIILRNLVSNAIKFSNTGGKIKVLAHQKNGFVQVDVTDFGVGIDKENLEKMLSKNEFLSTTGTNNEKGSGLGLILCREFVEKHCGKIWAVSEVGSFTTISFTLPKNIDSE